MSESLGSELTVMRVNNVLQTEYSGQQPAIFMGALWESNSLSFMKR